MTALLRVEPVEFVAASRVIGETVADRVLTALWQLVDELDATAAMAGSDPGGVAWGKAYDDTARVLISATTDTASACFRLAALLQQSGLNYGRAEIASAGGEWTDDRNDYADRAVYCSPPVSAVGGGGPTPAAWSLVEHAVGYVWPNGHQDRFRAAAAAWSRYAIALECAADDVAPAVATIAGQQVPEVDRALAACSTLRTTLGRLAATGRSLATACEEYAEHLDDAHSQVEHELVSLLEWTAAIEAVGAVGAVFTFGASEAAAQAAETSRLAATAVRVAEIIGKLASLARGAAEYLANLGYDLARIPMDLNPLLTSRAVVALAEARGGLAMRAAADQVTPRLAPLAEASASGVQPAMTIHGAERLAQAGLDEQGLGGIKSGLRLIQADGAAVFLKEVAPGKFDFIVQGERGIVTAHRGWTAKAVTRIARNYGWEGWPP